MSEAGKRTIVERIEAIAAWRQEREFQDMLGLGPEAAARSRRSADGLRLLAGAIAELPADDDVILQLERLAFSGDQFVPGATLLTELGRFRFHDPEQDLASFPRHMIGFAEQDLEEMGRWGGPQVSGDNPWGATWVVQIDDEEDEDDW